MLKELVIEVYGNVESEHITRIKDANGNYFDDSGNSIYFDGYEGVSYIKIARFLDFLGVSYFTVIRKKLTNSGLSPSGKAQDFDSCIPGSESR